MNFNPKSLLKCRFDPPTTTLSCQIVTFSRIFSLRMATASVSWLPSLLHWTLIDPNTIVGCDGLSAEQHTLADTRKMIKKVGKMVISLLATSILKYVFYKYLSLNYISCISFISPLNSEFLYLRRGFSLFCLFFDIYWPTQCEVVMFPFTIKFQK